jgi:iron complex transport system ATP-binding protein
MIAKALSQQTPIIMLDEPTAHLDLINKLRLMKLLRDLAHNQGKAIIISTHDLDLALQSADKIWLLQNDKTLRSGAPEELVLNGAFEKAFAEADITFDYTRGTFVFQSKKGKTYCVKGDDAHAFWTRKALNRNGFETHPNAEEIISYNPTKEAWELQSKADTHSFNNLEELIRHLKSKNDNA